MKRFVVVGLVTALVLSVTAAAVSAPTKKKAGKKAKPVKTTLFMHGSEILGEAESNQLDTAFLPMDATKPEASEPKSKQMLNYVGGPNTACAGNTLFPVWSGALKGTVKGTMKVSIGAVATPAAVEVRVWPDVTSLLCDSGLAGTSEYPKPAATFEMTLLPGMNEATVKGVKFKAQGSMMVQVTPVDISVGPDTVVSPSFTRVLYDSTDFPTSISFKCKPPKGKKSCA